MHWPWATISVTHPFTQASSPRHAGYLLPLCIGSGLQPKVNNLPQASPGNQTIMFSSSLYLNLHFPTFSERETEALLGFSFTISLLFLTLQQSEGALRFLSVLGREFPYVIFSSFLRCHSFSLFPRYHNHG